MHTTQDIGKKTDDPDNEEERGGKRVAPKDSFTPVAKRTERTKGMAIGKRSGLQHTKLYYDPSTTQDK